MPSNQPPLLVNVTGLAENRRNTSFRAYLKSLIRYRSFVIDDARSRAFRTTEGYFMWQLWLVLSPLLEAAMYGFLFGFVFHSSRAVDNFPVYLLTGLAVFTLITRLTGTGSGVFQSNIQLVRTFDFPGIVVALAQALRALFDALPSLVFGLGVAIILQLTSGGISPAILFIIPIVFMAAVFGVGLMFQVAAVTAVVPDAKAIVSLFLRAWMFFSCIFYPISRFDGAPTVRFVAELNPAYQFISATRYSLIDGGAPILQAWAVMMVWAICSLVLGILALWMCERHLNEL